MNNDFYVIPDTNFFIECKPIDELPWRNEYNKDVVNILLLPEVLKEIDNHKKSSNSRRARKARKILTFLEPLLAEGNDVINGKAKDGVTYNLTFELGVALDAADSGLESDDKIVKLSKKIADKLEGKEVLFLCADLAALLKAKAANLNIFKIPDEWKVQSESASEVDEVKELKEELAQIRKINPFIELEKTYIEVEDVRYIPLNGTEVEFIIDELKRKNPIASQSKIDELARIEESGPQAHKAALRYENPSELTIKDYFEGYSRWISNCKKVLEDFHKEKSIQDGFAHLDIILRNVGGRPALDTIVKFTPRADVMVSMEEDKFDRSEKLILPEAPKVPRGKWKSPWGSVQPTHFGDLYDDGSLPYSFPDNTRDPNLFYFASKKTVSENEELKLVCDQWRHGAEDEVFSIRLIVPKDFGSNSFVIGCEVHANNLNPPLKKNIKVAVISRKESCFDLAKHHFLD